MRLLSPWELGLALLAFQFCLFFQAQAQDCQWSHSVGNKIYSFNLGAPLQLHPHGIRSEDGHYKVVQNAVDESDEEEITFYFQLCEHMKFNSDYPSCQFCPQSCGGSEHCGETCSGLQTVTKNGYSKCVTLAASSTFTFGLMDESNPALGVSINMSQGDTDLCPEGRQRSLKINVECAANGVVQLPTVVKEEPNDSCQYVAAMVHPSGCPVVTSSSGAGVGWFGIFLILLLCGIIVYFVVGLAYRTLVLGVSGIEAIPNLEFWQALPSNIQAGWAYVSEKIVSLYRTWTNSNYSRVT